MPALTVRQAPAVVIPLVPLVGHVILTHHVVTDATQTALVTAAALSHSAIYGSLGLLFGLSLRPGQEALVSRLARRVELSAAADVMAYTRGVTWLWTAFCALQLLTSWWLLIAAPLAVWSTFVNVLDVPLVILTFLAEYAVRRWRFRGKDMASLSNTVRAFARRDTRREEETCSQAPR
jgi:uncharacterized membrane protein